MKNKKHLGLSLTMLSALVLASCGKAGVETYPVTGPYMTGKTAKAVYKAYLGSAPTSLDPTKSQNAQNVSHLANLIGTLVMNDNYGILRKELASSAWRSADFKEYKFGIRNDVKWVTSSGEPYVYKNAEQYVKAEDFVQTAKIILDYRNSSEIYYMYTLFVSNAWEYYCYTMMVSFMAEGKTGYTDLKGNNDKQAEVLTKLVKQYSGSEPETPISGSDISDISAFKRVGVKVNTAGELQYNLKEPAQFFPTMLTYTPFMPTNPNFYKQKKDAYGTTKDNLLYCGPYRLTKFESNAVQYKKNDSYINSDKVHVKEVDYQVVDASISYTDMREAFDRNDVDGFSLNSKDEIGWKNYITGPDGTGTMQNPYSDKVNSRELDDVDYTYHMNIDINRPCDPEKDENTWKDATYWDVELKGWTSSKEDKAAIIKEQNEAVHVKEIRKLILNAFDIDVYNDQYTVEDKNQYQINTFTPRGYVYDEYANDYINYYYEEYAEQKGLSGEGYEATEQLSAAGQHAKAIVGPQVTTGVQYLAENEENQPTINKYNWLSLNNLRNDGIKSLELLRAAGKVASDRPLVIDFFGIGGLSADSLDNETELVKTWNERANGCTLSDVRAEATGLPVCSTKYKGETVYPYFYMVHNKISEQTKWEEYSNAGYYTVAAAWGWMGDYADPLTYMHCYVTNGEMAKMTGNNTPDIEGFHLNAAGTALEADGTDGKMLSVYNQMVDDAKVINSSNHERFEKFAEAEYYLLNELCIIKPTHMSSQGWAASVSRACGYENPSAPYGLADHRLDGIWVLVDVPTGTERKEAREKQKELKAQELAKSNGNTITPLFE